MSSFIRRTKHPVTGKFEEAAWIDDYFGSHKYGVNFPSEPQNYYNPEVDPIVPAKEVSSCCGSEMFWADGVILTCHKCGKECTGVYTE